ncbi:trehalose-phosphatase [bacterium]|nr:MAG: trehalose-phosphatase [bacterium]
MKYFFEEWEKLREALSDKFIFLFLDYDGTLTPLVDNPQDADLSLESRELLRRLKDNSRCKIAITSGRKLEDLKKRVGLEGVLYVGNHGLEIEGTKINFKSPLSLHYLKTLQEIKKDLGTNIISAVRGAFIEDKGLALTLHYRLVDKKDIPRLKDLFRQAMIAYMAKDKICLKDAKMAFEIRPPVRWDKGKVAIWLLARQHFMLQEKINIIPLYIGDDVTDEDAFKALKNKGITVRVDGGAGSSAKYFVKDTSEVFRLLEEIGKVLA